MIWKKLRYLVRVLRGVRWEKLAQSLQLAQQRSRKPKLLLFFDMLWCAARYGAGYHDYVMFGFYNMDGKHRDTYVTRLRNKRMISLLNRPDTADLFDCKTRFYPRFSAYLGRDFLLTDDMTFADFTRFLQNKQKIFAKPDVGESGKGIVCLNVSNFTSSRELYEYLKVRNFGVIEEAVVQHPSMQALYPHSVNTLRIVTLLTGTPGAYSPQCVYAVVKLGAGRRYVDNLESGGLFCPIDRDTGVITGVGHTSALTTLTHHPDTGVPLMGSKIPFVKEAIALCLRAAMEEQTMRFVGWDCAITEHGPIIIEGNDYPGYDFWQQPEHTPDRIGLWPYYRESIPELR